MIMQNTRFVINLVKLTRCAEITKANTRLNKTGVRDSNQPIFLRTLSTL
jgi:hypothetical protein